MTETISKLPDAAQIAARFVAARRNAAAITTYPGEEPASMGDAYEVQEAAIRQWSDEIAGWKIGLVQPPYRERFGALRIAGPIFRRQVQRAGDAPVDLPVIGGGFAAVEAEFVLRIGSAPRPDQRSWTPDQAAAHADAMFIGVELAGSPFAAINDHGPAVTASDFGNNAGLVLGPEVPGWETLASLDLVAETFIDGVSVGRGSAANIPGGPFAALAFIFEHCAQRGRALAPGMLISTGATTGVHVIAAGQSARMSFGGFGEINCRAVDAASISARMGVA